MPTLNTRLRLVTIGVPVLLTDHGLALVPLLGVTALAPVLGVAALAPLLDRESWTLGTWLRGLLLVRSVSLDNFRITISRRWGGALLKSSTDRAPEPWTSIPDPAPEKDPTITPAPEGAIE